MHREFKICSGFSFDIQGLDDGALRVLFRPIRKTEHPLGIQWPWYVVETPKHNNNGLEDSLKNMVEYILNQHAQSVASHVPNFATRNFGARQSVSLDPDKKKKDA